MAVCAACSQTPAFDFGDFALCPRHYKIAEAHYRWRVQAGHATVYFAELRDQQTADWRLGLVKIGSTHDLDSRMRSLRCRAITTQPGDLLTERAYHDAFSADRVRGEWFARTPAMLRTMRAISRRDVDEWLGFAS
jgi:hypothetical protein